MTNGGSVRSISFNSAPVFATENAIKSFKKAIKSILTILEGLPLLPREPLLLSSYRPLSLPIAQF
jgi:hypothetical protein